MPSLTEASILAVARRLWQSSDVVEQIKSAFSLFLRTKDEVDDWTFATNEFEWVVTSYVAEQSLCLGLPCELLQVLNAKVEQLGRNVWMWLWDFAFCLFSNHRDRIVDYLSIAHWTLQGKIDSLKMLESILDDKEINIFTRFKVGCTFCMEECVVKLFWEINERHLVQSLMKEIEPYGCRIMYWIQMGHNMLPLHDFRAHLHPQYVRFVKSHEGMFKSSVRGRYVSAVRYFWSKLTPEEKQNHLVPLTISSLKNWNLVNHSVDNICFLLSQMDASQQMLILKTCSMHLSFNFLLDRTVSLSFLLSIHPNIFNNMTNSGKHYLMSVLCKDLDKLNIEPIFEVVWGQAPCFKHAILSKFDEFVMCFARHGSTKCIKMLLHEDCMDRMYKFMKSDSGLEACMLLILRNKFAFVEELLRETFATDKIVKSYKQRIMLKNGSSFSSMLKCSNSPDKITNLQASFSPKLWKKFFFDID